MRISDAKVGDVLRDKDGDVWVIDKRGCARLVLEGAEINAHPHAWALDRADATAGPFTRLTPEPTNAP